MAKQSPERQLETFIARYTPEIAALARSVVTRLREKLPGALILVYDNYNALAIGFAPNERASDAIFSVALYPKWVSFFFLQGAGLADPNHLLRGSGKQVRHIVLANCEMLDSPEVQALMTAALNNAKVPIDPDGVSQVIIKSISANQRPRRPAPPKKKK